MRSFYLQSCRPTYFSNISATITWFFWSITLSTQWLSSKESTCNQGDMGSIPVLGRSPGGGHGNPLQYSCLENPQGPTWVDGWSCRTCHQLDDPEDRPVGRVEGGDQVESQRPGKQMGIQDRETEAWAYWWTLCPVMLWLQSPVSFVKSKSFCYGWFGAPVKHFMYWPLVDLCRILVGAILFEYHLSGAWGTSLS